MYNLYIYGKINKYEFVLHLNVNYLNSVILLLSGNVVISCRVTFDRLLKASLTVNTAILYWAPTKKNRYKIQKVYVNFQWPLTSDRTYLNTKNNCTFVLANSTLYMLLHKI